ncbi:MAG: adenylosuccinate synthetase [Clostridia bacterium]|nr:adenylosuccinate synthetase [Clostridia bacterium]
MSIFNIDSFINEAYGTFSSRFNEPFVAGYAVAGAHFGDEGKGKIVDALAELLKKQNYKIINYRGQGGGNAGHTVIDSKTGKEYHFHYLPSGGLKSDLILLGGGMLLDPIKVAEEAKVLPDTVHILVDERATLSILMERQLDGYYESLRKSNGIPVIGTTGSGVGTTAAHRALRVHVTFGDASKITSPEELCKLFKQTPDLPEEIANQLNTEYCAKVLEAVHNLKIVNSSVIFQKCIREGWAGLLELSQAFGLDMIHGNCGHYVTSTHTTIPGALADVGLAERDIPNGSVIIAKAYASKVGAGPFITKFGEVESEIAKYIYDVNGERGVTTGRIRDLGWFDCVAVSEALRKNGTKNLAINCMDTIGKIPGGISKICIGYKNKKTGDEIAYWPYNQDEYEPIYTEISTAWDIKHFTDEKDIPLEVWNYIAHIEVYTGGYVKYIGTGGGDKDIVIIGDYGREQIANQKNFVGF